jgi:hypothetical protein
MDMVMVPSVSAWDGLIYNQPHATAWKIPQ